MKIPFSKVDCSGNELNYIQEVLESGWLTTASKAKAFEKRFEMSSEECYSRFNSGNMGDDGDIFEWISLYENILLYQKRLNLLGVPTS